ncbi:hypothetical protein Patl1_34579 [Pistacia atlantica]|uniref:Uncharacterized protein n=1 Tax=Pistacia atlantica TaxID=434234 RepID=A0ACC0ZPQ2_9ROSI|nr:hypothetical protein Patl1_34579 [Pistacia atlantica]
MPKSKHDRAVTLSKTKKKGRELKELIVNSIREAVENYNSIYFFSFENMRTLKFKEFRDQLKPTSCLFNKYEEYDFARTGSTATEKVELSSGPLEQFTHEMEPLLRKQGMPVRLNKGVVELVSDFVVCEEGKPISPESARILVCSGLLAYFLSYSIVGVPSLAAQGA